MKHEERAHSELGGSGAHRWIPCPGSRAAQRGKPNPTNPHAARGTAAHEVGEKCLKNGFDADRFIGDIITITGVNAAGEPVSFDFEVDEKMAEDVQSYVTVCRADAEPGDVWWIEAPIDLSHLHPGMYGSCDWGCYKRKERRLIVRDYKNGFGVVDVPGNAQLRFYALGLLKIATDAGHPVDTITMGVVQPNAPHVHGPSRDETIDVLDLLDFQMEIVLAARRTEDPSAKRVAGDHCDYCLDAHDCPALTAVQRTLAAAEFEPLPDMDVRKITQLLDAATMMDARLKAAWALAQQLAERGIVIPGYKLVERKTRRKWKADDEGILAAELATTYGLQGDDLFAQKLKSPAKIEKLIKAPRGQTEAVRAAFNANFTERPPAGMTLARDVDPRVALTASDPTSEFEPIDAKPALLF